MSNETDTCRQYIEPKLREAGWEDENISEQMVLTPGRIVPIGDRHTRKVIAGTILRNCKV